MKSKCVLSKHLSGHQKQKYMADICLRFSGLIEVGKNEMSLGRKVGRSTSYIISKN